MSTVTMSLPCHPEDSAGVAIPVAGTAAVEVGMAGTLVLVCKDSDFSYSSSLVAIPSPRVPEAYRGLSVPLLCCAPVEGPQSRNA